MSSVIESVDRKESKEKMEGSFVLVSPEGSPKKTPLRRSRLRPDFPINVSRRREIIKKRGHGRSLSVDAVDRMTMSKSPAILSIGAESDCLDVLSDDFSDKSSMGSVELPPPIIAEAEKSAPAILFSPRRSMRELVLPPPPVEDISVPPVPPASPPPAPAPDIETIPLIWSPAVRYPSMRAEAESIERTPASSVTPAHVARLAILNGF